MKEDLGVYTITVALPATTTPDELEDVLKRVKRTIGTTAVSGVWNPDA